MLNQHPEVMNYGEVLGDWTLPGRHIMPRFFKKTGAAGYLNWLYQSKTAFAGAQTFSYVKRRLKKQRTHFRKAASVKTIGVKEFIVNLRRFELLDYVLSDSSLKLVTLVRENPLHRHVSNLLMSQTGQVVRTEVETVKAQQIHIDLNSIISALDIVQEENNAVADLASKIERTRIFPISYENYFTAEAARRNETDLELLSFLGVKEIALPTEHKRIRQSSLADTIANYAELTKILAGTSYEKHLDA